MVKDKTPTKDHLKDFGSGADLKSDVALLKSRYIIFVSCMLKT